MPTYHIITQSDKKAALRTIWKLKEGVRFDVKISRHHPKRSIPQNRTYWMWVGCIHEETGEDQNYMHLMFRQMYLGMDSRTVFGRIVEEPRHTKTLSTVDFTVYMEKVQAWAATELAIRLPTPEDLAWAEFYERYGERYG